MGFNFRNHRVKQAAIDSDIPKPPAINPDFERLLGKQPQEQLEGVSSDLGNILKGSPNPYGDAHSALQNTPYKPTASPQHLQPANAYWNALKAHSLAKELVRLTGFDPNQPLTQKAFEEMMGQLRQKLLEKILAEQHQSGLLDPSITDIFSERGGAKKMDAFFTLQNRTAQKEAVNAMRAQTVRELQNKVREFIEKCRGKYQATDPEIIQLLWYSRDLDISKIGDGTLAGRITASGDNPKTVSGEADISSVVSAREMKSRMGRVWSGKSEPGEKEIDDSIYPVKAPIDVTTEILTPLGINILQAASRPSDEFVGYKVPYAAENVGAMMERGDREKLKVRLDIEEKNRKDPHNMERLGYHIVNGGFENGDGLAALLDTSDTQGKSGDTRYSAMAILYCYQTLCQRSKVKFGEMLDLCGYGQLKSKLYTRVYADTQFPEYNLNYRSLAEKQCVEKLRSYGLAAVPYPIQMPAPQECPTNDNFVIDFTVPCDIIVNWTPDPTGVYHPSVHSKVVFAGEYFGMSDHGDIKRVPQGRNYIGIDGELQSYTNKQGEVVPMSSGEIIRIGDEYKVRTQWKKMSETVVAHLTGNNVIHLDKDLRDKPIMAELDRNHIVYNSPACDINDPTCSIALHQILEHAKTCTVDLCDCKKYVHEGQFIPSKVSQQEAYIRSAIAELQISRVNPVFRRQILAAPSIDRISLFEYYKGYEQQEQILQDLWSEYAKAYAAKDPSAPMLLQKYQIETGKIQDYQHAGLTDARKSIMREQQDRAYIQAETQLKELLTKASEMDGANVKTLCDAIVRPWTKRS